jgi:hypothetical protein
MKKRLLLIVLSIALFMPQYQMAQASEPQDNVIDSDEELVDVLDKFQEEITKNIEEQQEQKEEALLASVPKMEVRLSHTSLTLLKGDVYKLTVTGTSDNISWSSSDEKVATVDDKGKITAISIGSANISATVNDKAHSCKLTIKKQLSENKTFVVKDLKYTITKEATTSTAGTVSVGANNKNIKTVSIPQTIKFNGKTYKVTAISDNGFLNCSKLITIKMDSYKLEQTPNLKAIGTNAFAGCNKLQKVLIDIRKVTTLKAYAFYNCTSLTQVGAIIDGLAITWSAFEKRPYEKYNTSFDSLKEVQKYTFYNCEKLEICYFNEKININEYAFYNCNKIRDMDSPGNVGDYAFYNCDNLTKNSYFDSDEGFVESYDYGFIFEEGTIGKFSYADCDGVKQIILASKVEINDYAFYNCKNMDTIYYRAVKECIIKIPYETAFFGTRIDTLMFEHKDAYYFNTSLYEYAVNNGWRILFKYPFQYGG